MPPWEVTGEEPSARTRRKWYLRWRVYTSERNAAAERKTNKPGPSPWGPEWDD